MLALVALLIAGCTVESNIAGQQAAAQNELAETARSTAEPAALTAEPLPTTQSSPVPTAEPPTRESPTPESQAPTTTPPPATAQPTAVPDTQPTAPPLEARPTPDAPAPTPAPEPETTPKIDAWARTYRWEESAPGDPGSNQSILHELVLTSVTGDGSLSGTFTETGFQTNISVPVVAFGGEGGITIFATANNQGLPLYEADQRLFALIGDPAAPTTELAAVQGFLSDVPQTGIYFR